ncbi:MAG: GTP 3',8-cyclase MoaA [Finegoldia sp.]|nr:GTP 3',8-cyclase MoaA [Finegoldia sp.]
MLDKMGRDINYLRISCTQTCNLRCRYCMPEKGIFEDKNKLLTDREILEIVKVFKKLGVKKVRITGGEPLVRAGIVGLVSAIKDIGIDEVVMTTNAILLEDMAADLKKAGLSRINVSLDTMEPDKFSYMSRGGNLLRVKRGIEAALKAGLKPLKINTVIMKGFNDDEILDFVNLANPDISVRFIELMPIGQAITYKDSYISSDEILEKIKEAGLRIEKISSDKSEVADYFKIGDGKIGFINPISHKFCKDCNRMRLASNGNLISCLHSNERVNLKNALEEGDDLERLIRETVYNKPEKHRLEEGKYNLSDMNTIGG